MNIRKIIKEEVYKTRERQTGDNMEVAYFTFEEQQKVVEWRKNNQKNNDWFGSGSYFGNGLLTSPEDAETIMNGQHKGIYGVGMTNRVGGYGNFNKGIGLYKLDENTFFVRFRKYEDIVTAGFYPRPNIEESHELEVNDLDVVLNFCRDYLSDPEMTFQAPDF